MLPNVNIVDIAVNSLGNKALYNLFIRLNYKFLIFHFALLYKKNSEIRSQKKAMNSVRVVDSAAYTLRDASLRASPRTSR
ncbi:hypothetical protein ANSO36C_59240 [Nostoc cf. commune SO-36]|uniref:Uncharacterized protein n=1 Tax=Nostoc cf. commune SO-36 TaxID=449208 RepID=A0ABN6QF59_NOSCO|nr:hypothetical protein ANSO36C_59240 [Nostoc cf. commune SO-36]